MLVRAVCAGVLFATALFGASGCRRRTARPAEAHPAPAGGAATDDDAGTSIVEDAQRYAVETWSFPLDRFAIRIEDVGMKSALDDVLARTNAELVINAGFFDREEKPLGLAVSNGAVLSKLAPRLSGGVIASDGERARLSDSESFVLPEGTDFAVQCRPRLVVDGQPNVKRDDGHRSERTALCLRDEGHVVEVVVVRGQATESGGPSLFALGNFLSRHGCKDALNLDGGPSTGFAVRDGEHVHHSPPRSGIRQAIAFVRR